MCPTRGRRASRRFVRTLHRVVSIGRSVEILDDSVEIVAILRCDGEEGRVGGGLDVGIACGVVRGVAFSLRDETTEIDLSVGAFGACRRACIAPGHVGTPGSRSYWRSGRYAPGDGRARVGDGGRK